MSKFIKVLIIINGLLIPLIIIFMFYVIFEKSLWGDEPQSDGIIIGSQLNQATQDSLALQGISYSSPSKIYNSSNYVVKISAYTYEEPKEYTALALRALQDYSYEANYLNLLFLDKEYNVIGRLLDRKGFISNATMQPLPVTYGPPEMETETDTTFRHLTYLIGFNDTNNDNKLDYQDDHDLYISDLNGKHLTQVTTGKTVIEYQWLAGHKKIFIAYKDRNGLRDEYNPKKFALYDVKSRTFEELKDIHNSLKDIERMLLK